MEAHSTGHMEASSEEEMMLFDMGHSSTSLSMMNSVMDLCSRLVWSCSFSQECCQKIGVDWRMNSQSGLCVCVCLCAKKKCLCVFLPLCTCLCLSLWLWLHACLYFACVCLWLQLLRSPPPSPHPLTSLVRWRMWNASWCSRRGGSRHRMQVCKVE